MTLQEAIDYFGGGRGAVTKLAEAIRFTPEAVSNWKRRGGVIPYDAQCRLQVATKGKLKADPIDKPAA